MCSIANLQAPCVIYSLGSNKDVSFETDILKHTPCDVHTFDCTVDSINIVHNARHTFHKVCIGNDDPRHGNRVYESLDSIMKRLGHNKLAVLKMDIEGSEYEVCCCANNQAYRMILEIELTILQSSM